MALRVALGGSNLTVLTAERQFNPVHYDNEIQQRCQASNLFNFCTGLAQTRLIQQKSSVGLSAV